MSDAPTDRLRSEDVAELLHISKASAARLMGREIRAVKIGHAWSSSRRDVEAYIRAQTFGPDRPKRGYGPRQKTP